ncbi:MAG: hypothetical protein Hens3KO_04040 [Henriciella sp.]
MASNMRTSRAGIDVIKAFEGFRPRYQKLPDGRWIIGYGHLRDDDEGVQISGEEAEAILREYDLPVVERLIMDCILAPLNQNEFDALVSLAFNIGPKQFVKSDVVARINSGNRLFAAAAFDHWCKARIGGRVQVLDALVRRRAVEKALFLKAPGDTPAASSRVYKPINDRVSGKKNLPEQQQIGVERSPLKLERSGEPSENDIVTATEQAAASVRRRLVRILGEDPANEAPYVDDGADGASPEEITAAISALAGESTEVAINKSMWPHRDDDLPPPPFMDDVTKAAGNIDQQEIPASQFATIDDLEEVKVSRDDIRRAIALNNSMDAHEKMSKWFDIAPFALLSLIGLGFLGYGFFGLLGTNAGYDEAGSLAVYMPAFMVLLGGILFVTMTYYLVRLFVEDNA